MHSRHGKYGATWIDLMIVLLLLFCLASILFPIFVRNRKVRQPNCMSQVRQLAIAAQMYDQDNHDSYPDLKWPGELLNYLGNNPAMLHCPEDKSPDTNVSYGYSGLLIRADGSGVKDKDFIVPAEVGVLCDAALNQEYPEGGLVGGGGLQPVSMAVAPVPRHSGRTVVGYADGHAAVIPNGYHAKDSSNGVTRAFDMAGALGFIDNPAGGISNFPVSTTSPERVTVGGEPSTRAILLAAADVWHVQAKAPVVPGGFRGQYAVQKRGASYLWGSGDGNVPAGKSVAIARDLVVVIIAQNSKIPPAYFCQGVFSSRPVAGFASLQTIFMRGYRENTFQAYSYDNASGTRRFFAARLGTHGQPLQISPQAITVKDDFAMVKTVAANPYGIGYCSSTAADTFREEISDGNPTADPNRIQVIGLRMPDGRVYLFPQQHLQPHKFISANLPDWPLTRTLYAECGGNAWRSDRTGIANVMLIPGAPGTKALQAGPLFRASFWMP